MNEEQQSTTTLTSVKRGTAVYILVVDDDQFANTLVHFVLSKEGYDVEMIDSARGAMQMVQKREPDLLLLDVTMPYMDGFEVISQLRKDSKIKTTPVIAVTALAVRDDRERLLRAGFNDYISKPYMVEDIEATVRRYLRLPVTIS